MAKYLHLQIPQSCHEDWNKMLPDEKGKFCLSCQKQVTDFSKMSDRELVAYFKNYKGTGCGKFSQEQLDRDILIQRKSMPWLKYFFQLAIPAFLLSLKSIGQSSQKGRVMVVVSEQVVSNLPAEKIASVDTLKKPAVKSKAVKKARSGSKLEAFKEVELPLIQADKIEHRISSNIIDHAPSEQIINTQALVGRVGGFIAGVKIISKRDNTKAKKECKQDSPSFTLYPNPLLGSSNINVKWQGLKKGLYILEVYNSQGALMQAQEINIESWMTQYTLKLHLQVSGVYVARLTNRRTGIHLSEQFIVK